MTKIKEPRAKRQWADQYGSQWYKHYDGKPPHDDDNDYDWNGFQWVRTDYDNDSTF